MKLYVRLALLTLSAAVCACPFQSRALAETSPTQAPSDALQLKNIAEIYQASGNGSQFVEKLKLSEFLTQQELATLSSISGFSENTSYTTIKTRGDDVLVSSKKNSTPVRLKVINLGARQFTLNDQPWTFQPWASPIANMQAIAEVIEHGKTARAPGHSSLDFLIASMFEKSAYGVLGIDDGIIATLYIMGFGLWFVGCEAQNLAKAAGPIVAPAQDLTQFMNLKQPLSCIAAAASWPILSAGVVYKYLIEPAMAKMPRLTPQHLSPPTATGLQCKFRTDKKTHQQVVAQATMIYDNGMEMTLSNLPDGSHLSTMKFANGTDPKTQKKTMFIASQLKFDKNWVTADQMDHNAASVKLLQISCENPSLRHQFDSTAEGVANSNDPRVVNRPRKTTTGVLVPDSKTRPGSESNSGR